MCQPVGQFDCQLLRGEKLRAGFTLLEILLVLAIIVAISSVAAMIVKTAYQGQRLQAAADRVRYALNQTRYLAMSSGQTYVVRFAIGGNEAVTGQWESDAAGDTPAAPVGGKIVLSEGMSFSNGGARDMRTPTSGNVADFSQSGGSSSGGQVDVFYYPDGSSSEATIVVANREKREIGVAVHGLTGTSAVLNMNANPLAATGSGS
jgi:prepilin-type N-terminal cleavage/methylation domain-containing protein